MAGIRNLAQTEAVERARLVEVQSYDITLDLTDGAGNPGERTFRSRTEVAFRASRPGAETFIEVAAGTIHSATLNGAPVDISAWAADKGLPLTGLAADNTLVIDAEFPYSNSGQGLHRAVDPVDHEVYLYSQFETSDAQRVYAAFDQPDLKAEFTWRATVPAHWQVISNMPVSSTEHLERGKTVHFERSPRMSTYVTALCAGPYHVVNDTHDGVDLAVYCRRSLADHLDADDLLLITKQGFDFFQNKFGVRYPLPKYDQLLVPEYNAGAMENFGAVTISEEHYLFRSQVTDFEYEQRANTILHELAHMWFGDLVTMRWWDDLWLNESFAEWASHWAGANATRFADSWTTFLALRKRWGYQQDQLSSTHPVYTEAPDVEAAEVNFDGITYAKGASVIKQLVAYVGEDAFVAGLRAYFAAHAWSNATFDDLLGALEEASGRKLRDFAAQWLETAQVNTLRPEVTVGPDGTYTSVAVLQEAPAAYPSLRSHRIAVGLYDLDGDRLVRRERLELDVTGERTEITALAGVRQPDVLLLNDDDLTYAKLRFDERSQAAVRDHVAGFASALPRGLAWAAAWDATRDGELPARDYVAQVLHGLPAESDVNLVTITVKQAASAIGHYADPAWAPTGWAQLAEAAKTALGTAEPGSDLQLTWARAYASAARDEADLAVLRGWLDGRDVPAGLSVDTGVRWHLVQCLVAVGALDPDAIDAELRRDDTASGQREATQARALVPAAEAKAETWRRLTEDKDLPNWLQRALLYGFQHPAQTALTAPYVQRYFADVAGVWANRDGEVAQVFAVLAYPTFQVSEATVAATDTWLTDESHPAGLRRLVAEGKDGILRALKARARDAAES